MKFYTLALHKAYFDMGYNLTSYFKLVITVFGIGGLTTGNVNMTLWLLVGYAIFCYVLGVAAFSFGYVDAIHEVGNRFNPFVKEMRKNKVLNRH